MTTIKEVQNVQDYLVESEMEGKVDPADPWYPCWSALEDIKEKIKEEQGTE